ncbi:MAG: YaiI/YqxD family protein [Alphaproteobacteria bacterium]
MTVLIYIDADACPVKDEVYTVAGRHQTPTIFVANEYIRIPRLPLFTMQVVDKGFDAADDWIAERANARSIVVTADILLAQRCIEAGASVIAHTGKPFTEANIGNAVATRAIMQDLRAGAGNKNTNSTAHLGGPAPFSKADRSRFLAALHENIERLKRAI